MKPCITTWPDSVPTVELDSPDAVSASAKSTLDAPPRSGSSVRCAPSSESTFSEPAAVEDGRGDDEHRHVDEPGDHHRDQDVDARVTVERASPPRRFGDDRGAA